MNAAQDHCAHVAAFARAQHKARLMTLRDEFVHINSMGRFHDAASREWRKLPHTWRATLLLVAGVGVDVDDLNTLASRDWQELPPPERDDVRGVVRSAKRHLGRLTALAAKV